jgi:AraC-like DNA-binding protein
MDAFGDLLRGVRADGATFGGSCLAAPWSLWFVDGPPLTLVTALQGSGWIVPTGASPRYLELGDTAIVRGPEPFVFTDDPTHARRADLRRDVHWSGADLLGGLGGPPIRDDDTGGGATAGTTIVAAAYRTRGEVQRRLLTVLPPLLVQPDVCEGDATLELLAAEVAERRPGREIVVDRFLDWLLVCTLRTWFDGPEAAAPGWYRALSDPVVGRVLRAVHDDPAHHWSLEELARTAGVARATLAKRFTPLVGEPPMAYVTGWRMTLAADLLAEPDTTLTTIARQVGYADAFSFSAAFKRVRGVSPTAYRTALAS